MEMMMPEKKIPVFTVMKKGAIFKNIFLLDKPVIDYSGDSSDDHLQLRRVSGVGSGGGEEEEEEVLIVGRHPDCNIMLEHPSISRFHLEIRSRPGLQRISVIDLGSAHGTWVSEKKIEGGVVVELIEGDTLRLGASTRVYKLHWMPISKAYDIEDPFISQILENELRVKMKEAEENEVDEEDWMFQNENGANLENQSHMKKHEAVEEEQEFQNENDFSVLQQKQAPSAPSLTEGLCFSIFDDDEDDEILVVEVFDEKEIRYSEEIAPQSEEGLSFSEKCVSLGVDKDYQDYPVEEFVLSASEVLEETEIQSLVENASELESLLSHDESALFEDIGNHGLGILEYPVAEYVIDVLSDSEFSDSPPLRLEKRSDGPNLLSAHGKSVSLIDVEIDRSEGGVDGKEGEINNETASKILIVLSDSEVSGSPPIKWKKMSDGPSIWSRRGKYASMIDVEIDRSEGVVDGKECKMNDVTASKNLYSGFDSKEDVTPNSVFRGTLLRDASLDEGSFSSDKDGKEDETNHEIASKVKYYGLDSKENVTPNSALRDISVRNASVETESLSLDRGGKEDDTSDESALKIILSDSVFRDTSVKNAVLDEESFSSDGESFTPESKLLNSSRVEEEVFTPGKNYTPTYLVGGKSESGGNSLTSDKECSAYYRAVLGEKSDENNLVKEEIFTPNKEKFTAKRLFEVKAQESPIEEVKQRSPWSLYCSSENSRVEGIKIESPGLISSDHGAFSEKENRTPIVIRSSKSKKPDSVSRIKQENEVIVSKRRTAKVPLQLMSPGSVSSDRSVFYDKENLTPIIIQHSKSKKSEFASRRTVRVPFQLMSPGSVSSDCNVFSEKENLTPIITQHSKSKNTDSASRIMQENEKIMSKRKVARVPFQSLFSPSNCTTKSETLNINTVNSDSIYCGQIKEKYSLPSLKHSKFTNIWNMVVDTNCLLDKDSRHSLQLLQGLKGTHLIIPRTVIRKLDCLKRQGSLFRRETEASLVLQWIGECMVTSMSWISVQEELPVASIPPASLQSQQPSKGNDTSRGFFPKLAPFFPCKSLVEVVSPTAGDHTLEYALLMKKTKRDEKLVILSNNVGLKIKAMAEGLNCETAEEFRHSLLDTSGNRFMYSESTPRGPTWSYADEAGLRENYHHFPMRKSLKSGEGVRGLKLILHYHSRYGQRNRAN